MRTNATVQTTVVVHLDQQERFNHFCADGSTVVVIEVGYSGGHTSYVGHKVLRGGALSKRTYWVHNVPPREVPDDIRESIVGAVRANVGEQARALGLLR
jgi:hypothetical protein